MQAAGTRTSVDGAYKSAYGVGRDGREAIEACLQALAPSPPGATLGLAYATDHLAGQLPQAMARLREATGVAQWCGTLGFGVAAPGLEIFDRPALSVLLLTLPEESFRLLPPSGAELSLSAPLRRWIAGHPGATALVHGDPRTPDLVELIGSLAELHGLRLVGGLSASRAEQSQVAGAVETGERAVLGLSGVAFAPGLGLEAGLSQGCSPIGPLRQVTAADGNLLISIDGRPALTVLAEDLGATLREDPRPQLAGVHLAFALPGASSSDFLVRNLVGLDPVHGILAVGETLEPGRRLFFVRRDAEAAGGDLERLLTELLARLRRPPRAAVYVSCVARGPNLFGPGSRELARLRAALGEVPLTGFYANGEICNRRLYGYTGVLTLFP